MNVLTERLERMNRFFHVLIGLLQTGDLISKLRMIATQKLKSTHDGSINDGEVVSEIVNVFSSFVMAHAEILNENLTSKQ